MNNETYQSANSERFAVLSNGQLLYSIADNQKKYQLVKREIGDISTLEQIFDVADAHNIRRIWVTPGDPFNMWPVNRCESTDKWEIKAHTTQMARNTFVLRTMTGSHPLPDSSRKRYITIAFVQHGAWYWTETDPITLLGAITYLRDALKRDVYHHPGVLGLNIMKDTNQSQERRELIKAPDKDYDIFADIPDKEHIGKDLVFCREIPDAAEGMILVGWDKNSAFLGAASSARLGAGIPELVTDHMQISLLAADAAKTRRPGYWHIAYDPQNLPLVSPLYECQEWVTTELLNVLIQDIRLQMEILEVKIWEKWGRFLDQYATELWDIRTQLNPKNPSIELSRIYKNEQARQIAYESIKEIATKGVGMLRNGGGEENQRSVQTFNRQWFRPDWQLIIPEAAKARSYRLLWKIYQDTGIWAVAGKNDAFYFLLKNEEEYAKIAAYFAPRYHKTTSWDQLGGWKAIDGLPKRINEQEAALIRNAGRLDAASRINRITKVA